MSPWIWVLLGAMLLGLGTCGGVVGLLVLGASGDDGGVLMGAQVPDAKKAKLRARHLLREDDELVAYYDATIALDMSEVAVLTTERLTHAKGSHVATVPLEAIVSIEHRSEGVIGDVIEVRSSSGERIRIEVAPFNDGVSFLNALEDETRDVNPDVVVRRQAPR